MNFSDQKGKFTTFKEMISIIQQKYSRSSNHFSASHFLPGFSKCERLHGHNYVVKVVLDYRLSDSKDLIDFRQVNSIIHSIIQKLDHKILLPGDSPIIDIHSVMKNANWLVRIKSKTYSFPQKDVCILEKVNQTTTENLAIYIHDKISQKIGKLLSKHLKLQLKVSVAETVGNEASYSHKIKD